MHQPASRKLTIADLRAARAAGTKLAMLTCYDFTTARMMHEASVPAILVGDSAASVILGHPNTLPTSLDFMVQITAAVRRGAPDCLLMGDMPFGSYQASISQGMKNVFRMVQLSGCDCVKIEAGRTQLRLIERLTDAGVAIIAHLGLRPQSVGVLGGYKTRGRTAAEAQDIVKLAVAFEKAGAAALLIEAVPPEVATAVVDAVSIPVIGCGAGPACHAFVFVTHDAIGLTDHRPRFVPELGDLATPMKQMFRDYVEQVSSGKYPAPANEYSMPANEKTSFTTAQGKRP